MPKTAKRRGEERAQARPAKPLPRYKEIAAALKAAIAAGAYPVGSLLPTEIELCAAHGISRFTAREAFRNLSDAGLILRRRGAGTTVIADRPPSAFVQPVGSIADLLQYARDARLNILGTEEITADRPLAESLGLEPGHRYLRIEGVRGRGPREPPVGLTAIYVRSDYRLTAGEIGSIGGAISEWLEKKRGARVARIDQRIRATTLSAKEAKRLNAEPNSAALATTRAYFDAAGRLMMASFSTHPAGRFVYAMTVRRDD